MLDCLALGYKWHMSSENEGMPLLSLLVCQQRYSVYTCRVLIYFAVAFSLRDAILCVYCFFINKKQITPYALSSYIIEQIVKPIQF